MPEADTVLVERGSELFRETRVEYFWDKQPTHQSQRAVLAEASNTASPDGTRHRPEGDARCSDTTPPSHKRVLIWRAIAIQGILRQALTRMRIGLHMLSIEVLLHYSFFMHFLALVSGLLRPSSDGSGVKVISVNNGLEGASIRKPRDDYHDQLDRRGLRSSSNMVPCLALKVFWQTFHWERSRFSAIPDDRLGSSLSSCRAGFVQLGESYLVT